MAKRYQLKVPVVRARMERLGLTNADLARASEITLRTLQRWFQGQSIGSNDAEVLARVLQLGTAEAFSGVQEQSLSQRFAKLQRFLSSRDNAFSQALRVHSEIHAGQPETIFLDAHPAHGYLSQHDVCAAMHDGFVPFAMNLVAAHAVVEVRVQMARRYACAAGTVQLLPSEVQLFEACAPHTMRAPRRRDGKVVLWLWIGAEAREVLFVSNTDLDVVPLATHSTNVLDLDDPEIADALCIRPTQKQLRAAGLPLGCDRVIGSREGRLDVPLHEVGDERSKTSAVNA